MQATLLRDYQGQPIDGWLMSEKLDGWRIMCDGAEFINPLFPVPRPPVRPPALSTAFTQKAIS